MGFVLPSGSIATLPWSSVSATTPATNTLMFASDFGANGALLRYDGTRWKPLNGSVVLATLDAVPSIVGSVEVISFQYHMPAALWALRDRLRVYSGMSKSGTTNTGIYTARIGSAGTISDATVFTGTAMASSAAQWGASFDLRLETATTTQMIPLTQITPGYIGSGNNAISSAVTITTVSSSLFFSIGIRSNGSVDTVSLVDSQLVYIASAN